MAFYTDGVISIPNVTGDIVITATAVAQAPHYTNLADPTSPQWKPNCYINSSFSIAARSGNTVCNPIFVNQGDIIRIKGVGNIPLNFRTGMFETEASTSGVVLTGNVTYDEQTDVNTFVVGNITQHYLRTTFNTPADLSVIIIKKNEEIPS